MRGPQAPVRLRLRDSFQREPAAGAATGRPVFCSSLFGLPQEEEARAYTFSLETFSQRAVGSRWPGPAAAHRTPAST
eukprot:scaffold1726_cov260-Pinguiococcus_pyrenoidosus.AAC.1